MASSSLALLNLLVLHLFINLPLLTLAQVGFNVELIHRDSPKSPLYDPSKTLHERLREATHYSFIRANHFHYTFSLAASNNTVISPITPNNATYLMTINVGTPARKILAIADTGSDLTWIECAPCNQCYEQVSPLFDPRSSSTYNGLLCNSDSCERLLGKSCGIEESTCHYTYNYGDGSQTLGNLASETFGFDTMMGEHIQIPKVAFGCSHQSVGTFNKNSAGLVGLGGGPLSLISQLGSSIKKKFSYCLVPYFDNSSSSQINFGANAVVSGPKVVSTPLITSLQETFYTVSLQSVTLNDHHIPLDNKDIIIDSGTTLTFLDSSTVQLLVQKLSTIIKLPKINDPEGLFNLCFDISENPNVKLPNIKFNFDGAVVKLRPLNTFVEIDSNSICLAIVVGKQRILGNIAQQNFHILYDLEAKKISFAHADCSKIL